MSLPPMEPSDRQLERGDVYDDDAQVLDSLISSDSEPPTTEDLPTVSPIAPEAQPRGTTRLLTGTITLQNSWLPVQILVADPDRTQLDIRALSDTVTDRVRISDDAGKVQAISTSLSLPASRLALGASAIPLLLSHTGPVFVSCQDAVGPVTLTWAAVTR